MKKKETATADSDAFVHDDDGGGVAGVIRDLRTLDALRIPPPPLLPRIVGNEEDAMSRVFVTTEENERGKAGECATSRSSAMFDASLQTHAVRMKTGWFS